MSIRMTVRNGSKNFKLLNFAKRSLIINVVLLGLMLFSTNHAQTPTVRIDTSTEGQAFERVLRSEISIEFQDDPRTVQDVLAWFGFYKKTTSTYALDYDFKTALDSFYEAAIYRDRSISDYYNEIKTQMRNEQTSVGYERQSLAEIGISIPIPLAEVLSPVFMDEGIGIIYRPKTRYGLRVILSSFREPTSQAMDFLENAARERHNRHMPAGTDQTFYSDDGVTRTENQIAWNWRGPGGPVSAGFVIRKDGIIRLVDIEWVVDYWGDQEEVLNRDIDPDARRRHRIVSDMARNFEVTSGAYLNVDRAVAVQDEASWQEVAVALGAGAYILHEIFGGDNNDSQSSASSTGSNLPNEGSGSSATEVRATCLRNLEARYYKCSSYATRSNSCGINGCQHYWTCYGNRRRPRGACKRLSGNATDNYNSYCDPEIGNRFREYSSLERDSCG